MTAGGAAVEAAGGGRPVLVIRPDVSPGTCSVEMLSTLARARHASAAACFLTPEGESAALVAGVTATDVPIVPPGAWLRGRWRAAVAARRARARWREAAASVQHELYRELRRHAGDERLPADFRRVLRETAHRCYDRSVARRAGAGPFPRRLLEAPSTFVWPSAATERARADAAARGVAPGAPVVAFEVCTRPDIAAAAVRALVAEGYTVVRVGDRALPAPAVPGVVDLGRGEAPARLDLHVLSIARFAVCGSAWLQQMTYLTNTPSLTITATDPFSAYPVRANGTFLFRTVVDLDSGRTLASAELLGEPYFRNRRNCGFRDATAADLIAALREMHHGVTRGWDDSDAQLAFRARVVEAGAALAPSVALAADWGPDDGFIGHGRLARVQAERVA